MRKLWVRVPLMPRRFLSQKLWRFRKNTRSCVENGCCHLSWRRCRWQLGWHLHHGLLPKTMFSLVTTIKTSGHLMCPTIWKWLVAMMTSSNGNIFRVTGHLCVEFIGPRWSPAQRPVTRSFDVFFDQHPNKRLSKQWWGWWFQTPSC